MWLKELKKLPGQRKDPIHDPCVLLEGRNEPTVGLGLGLEQYWHLTDAQRNICLKEGVGKCV
ncbi:hypothetical protein LEMLEM_LOCUS4829 [Lemmus lemmus]